MQIKKEFLDDRLIVSFKVTTDDVHFFELRCEYLNKNQHWFIDDKEYDRIKFVLSGTPRERGLKFWFVMAADDETKNKKDPKI